MKARLTEWGGMPMPGSPADFEKFLIRDTEKWGKVAKIAGVKLE
jgi:hypothetical protein